MKEKKKNKQTKKTQMTKTGDERGAISTDFVEIKWIIKV